MPSLELCHLSEDQIGHYIEIVARSRADHPYERRLDIEEAKAVTLLDPDFDPHGSWVAYLDGEPAGVALVIVERNRLEAGLDDGYVDIDVLPEHRGKGIEQKLMGEAIGYLRSRRLGNARARSPAVDRWRMSLFESHSFVKEHQVHVLARRAKSGLPLVPPPAGYTLLRKDICECSDADIGVIIDALNDSFRDHPSFVSERPERWMNMRSNWKDPILFSLAMSEGTIAGFCMSEVTQTFNRERGVKAGWIDMIGVRPPHRRRGLARAVLADGIRWLEDLGMNTIFLGVLARNEAVFRLYASFGFVKEQSSIWYFRSLRRQNTLRTRT